MSFQHVKVNKVKASVDLRIPSYLSVCLKWDKNLKDPGIITEVLEIIKERLVSHMEKGTQPHKYFSVKASWSLIGWSIILFSHFVGAQGTHVLQGVPVQTC